MSYHLGALAEAAFDRLGDRESLIFEGRSYCSGELLERSRRAAGGLIRIGVEPGERVVVLMANCPEVSVSYNALWRAGAVVTPVVFLVTPAELNHILVDSEAVAVITTSELLATVAAAVADAPAVRHVIVVGDPGPTMPDHVRTLGFSELEAGPPAEVVARGEDDLATLMYTGGTTGRSKGVMLSHRNLYRCSHSAYLASNEPGITRTLVPLPLSHAYGMIVTLAGMHAEEPGLAVLQRWFDPSDWVRLAAQHRVHRTSLVPAMIQMLLAQPLEQADLSQLRYVGSGAAPLAEGVRLEWERRVPNSVVLEGYGCTESGAVISTNPPARPRPGSVGLPIPGYEVKIFSDDDSELPVGENGEICVRSQGVMVGYWHSPDQSGQTLRGGWLHTGDIGHLDPDGYLYVVDRLKDLIIRGGFNVYPRDVEDVLLGHPAVAMAAVVGRPDERLGEEVVAFVSLRPGASATSAEIQEFARSQLAATKYPREVYILDTVPLTSVGKLDRKALRARLAG
ncbi:MAG: class I adenylate-forming enzyme family protein [Mycobacteriales bacterium]